MKKGEKILMKIVWHLCAMNILGYCHPIQFYSVIQFFADSLDNQLCMIVSVRKVFEVFCIPYTFHRKKFRSNLMGGKPMRIHTFLSYPLLMVSQNHCHIQTPKVHGTLSVTRRKSGGVSIRDAQAVPINNSCEIILAWKKCPLNSPILCASAESFRSKVPNLIILN